MNDNLKNLLLRCCRESLGCCEQPSLGAQTPLYPDNAYQMPLVDNNREAVYQSLGPTTHPDYAMVIITSVNSDTHDV